jgi:TRAP-type C4-dicarboxylate transport system permease small subunit
LVGFGPFHSRGAASGGAMLSYRRVAFLLDLAAAAMFCVLFGTIIAQTTMRYVLNAPLTQSLEFATVAFIWLVFWVASCNLSISDHVRFDIVYILFPEQVRRWFSVATNAFFIAIFVMAASETVQYFLFLRTQYTASMAITYQLAFFTYFIFFAVLPARMALNVAWLLSPRWQRRI